VEYTLWYLSIEMSISISLILAIYLSLSLAVALAMYRVLSANMRGLKSISVDK
jgi:hypothetical protein